MFQYMCRSLPKKVSQLIAKNPTFADDKIAVPLQAADMLAWHIRREHETNLDFGTLPLTTTLTSSAHLYSEITEDHLSVWANQFSEIPGATSLQGKAQWQEIRKTLKWAKSVGFIPPYGNRVTNISQWIRAQAKKLMKRM